MLQWSILQVFLLFLHMQEVFLFFFLVFYVIDFRFEFIFVALFRILNILVDWFLQSSVLSFSEFLIIFFLSLTLHLQLLLLHVALSLWHYISSFFLRLIYLLPSLNILIFNLLLPFVLLIWADQFYWITISYPLQPFS